MNHVAIGMSKRQVRRALGEPTHELSVRHDHGTVGALLHFGLRSVRRETWLYGDVPEQGYDTLISFVGRRVREVESFNLGS